MKVALLQHSYKNTDKETFEYIKKQIKKLSTKSVKLVVLQELQNHIYFPQTQDNNNFSISDKFDTLCDKYSSLAKKYKIVIVATFFEKSIAGVYHNSAIVFENNGSIVGKYRKMHIPDDPNFYEKYYFTPGDLGFNPIKTSVGNLGVMICWDQWFCEPARIMALKGADILIYPTAIGWSDEEGKQDKKRAKKSWINVQIGHSIANHLPIICANRVGFEKDISGDSKGITFWGNSFITNARGEIIKKAKYKDINLVCDIDMSYSRKLREIWPFFRDRRCDYYNDLLFMSRREYV
jgi:N-carbamoylputrescine amidase